MLLNLKIKNIAVIEEAEIEFRDGLNVLSGETGAGKSIIIDALSAVLGERTSKELIRTGAESAAVSALFADISDNIKALLEAEGISPGCDSSLLLSRSLNRDGRSICRINGEPVSAGTVKKIGRELIGIHGQHDNQALLSPECHYKFLDALGRNESLYKTYLERYNNYSALHAKYAELCRSEEERRRNTELLSFRIKELSDAEIRIGESEELSSRRNFFRSLRRISECLSGALAILSDSEDEPGVVTKLFEASKLVEEASENYKETRELAEGLRESAFLLEERQKEIGDALSSCAYDRAELERIEERLDFLQRLRTKYADSEEGLLALLEASKKELEETEQSRRSYEELSLRLDEEKKELLKAAKALSASRKEAAETLRKRTEERLAFLNMPNTRFDTLFEPCKLNPTGSDYIEFLISANKGEVLKPLSKIASGGELSRIMLALQNVLADRDNIGTMIFDEIDTGISGAAAEKIAISLKEAAETRQVICVTHSAKTAAYADAHFLITKAVVGERTYTRVKRLNGEERVEELARIIGGLRVTQLQRDSARELLSNASQGKQQEN